MRKLFFLMLICSAVQASQTVSIDTNSYSTVGIMMQSTYTVVSTTYPISVLFPFSQPITSTYTVISTTYPISVSASFSPPELTTVTYNSIGQPVTSTYTIISTTYPISVSASFTPPAITTVTHNNIGQPVTSTYTIISTTYPVAVTATIALPALTTTTFLGSGQPVTSTSTYVVNLVTSTFNSIGQPVTSTFTVVVATSALAVVSTYTLVNSSSPLPMGAVVSSITITNSLAQGTTGTIRMDSMNRVLTTGLPFGVISSTWNLAISTTANNVILISSPAAPIRTFLCGAACYNTAITTNGVVFWQTGSSSTANAAFPLGLPANNAPGIIWPGCSEPFFWGVPGGQIGIKSDLTAPSGTAVKCHIQYFQMQ